MSGVTGKATHKDMSERNVEEAVRRVERHRAMLASLVTAQTEALLELKGLVGRTGGAAAAGMSLADVDADIRRMARCRSLISGEAGGPRRARPKVLLVDDDPPTRNLISHFLRKEDFLVEKAGNGNEGLARAKSGKPDLLIVDAGVPGMNGLELLSFLKKDPETAFIPVLLLSSLNEEEDIVKSLGEGADFVIKPFSPRILVAMVKKILRDACDHAVDHRPL